ncbi:MAG TPA: hypothetical protein DCP92_01755 [Nitrospiraceae bacterium]|jgi:uncharacterized protein (TIGR00251 family)|nr:hypothetical protein [Nitrospiraceae bacterium]
MQLPFKKTRDGIAIQVKVRPRSSRKSIREVIGDTVTVDLTAPPVDGAANEQLLEILSEELGIRKSSFRILKGLSSRHKVVEIRGVEKI